MKSSTLQTVLIRLAIDTPRQHLNKTLLKPGQGLGFRVQGPGFRVGKLSNGPKAFSRAKLSLIPLSHGGFRKFGGTSMFLASRCMF